MALNTTQTILVQPQNGPGDSTADTVALEVSNSAAIPDLPSEHHVLVRVLAVALNPTDYKNTMYNPSPGKGVGSDFCGLIAKRGQHVSPSKGLGTRVCGAVFPYSRGQDGDGDGDDEDGGGGAFAEWVVADARLLLRVPASWDDMQGAALGGVGWGTVALALSGSDALALPGWPSNPSDGGEPVLVYGGATATGTMACQLLKLAGYTPVAVASTQSAALVTSFGAAATAAYTSPTCAETVRNVAGAPIRHVLDCITSPESVATCFASMARTGGRYACLEALDDAWRTRRLIRTKVVMGFEALGQNTHLGGDKGSTYSREANLPLFGVCQQWAAELQKLLDQDKLKHHPVREVPGGWEGIGRGLAELRRGEVRGQKLVVRLADAGLDPTLVLPQ